MHKFLHQLHLYVKMYMYVTFVTCIFIFSLFQDSLSFPDDVSTSGEFQALVKSLLTDPDERLSFSQLKKHQFFSSVEWDHLLAGTHFTYYVHDGGTLYMCTTINHSEVHAWFACPVRSEYEAFMFIRYEMSWACLLVSNIIPHTQLRLPTSRLSLALMTSQTLTRLNHRKIVSPPVSSPKCCENSQGRVSHL